MCNIQYISIQLIDEIQVNSTNDSSIDYTHFLYIILKEHSNVTHLTLHLITILSFQLILSIMYSLPGGP